MPPRLTLLIFEYLMARVDRSELCTAVEFDIFIRMRLIGLYAIPLLISCCLRHSTGTIPDRSRSSHHRVHEDDPYVALTNAGRGKIESSMHGYVPMASSALTQRRMAASVPPAAASDGSTSSSNLRRPPESSFLVPRHNRELGMVHAGAPSLRLLARVAGKLRRGELSAQ